MYIIYYKCKTLRGHTWAGFSKLYWRRTKTSCADVRALGAKETHQSLTHLLDRRAPNSDCGRLVGLAIASSSVIKKPQCRFTFFNSQTCFDRHVEIKPMLE